jgi:hypothetical protein
VSLAALSIGLGVTCISLEVISHRNDGLVNARFSTGFKFSWRFLPTIVAVIYSLFWTPVMKDILRTEPWALMSLPHGSSASKSLLKETKVWFVEVVCAVSNRKKKPGGIRWAVFLAILCSMGGTLLINPVSAGLLKMKVVSKTSHDTFTTILKPQAVPDSPLISDALYLSAISNLVYNTSQSAWFSNEYAVVPFWPASIIKAPLESRFAPIPQIWNAVTEVFKLQLQCQAFANVSVQCSADCLLTLQSSDGCVATFRTLFSQISNSGGSFWGHFDVRERAFIVRSRTKIL